MTQFIKVTVGTKAKPYMAILATRDILAVDAIGNTSESEHPTLDTFLMKKETEIDVFDHQGARYSAARGGFPLGYHRVSQGVRASVSVEEYGSARDAYANAMRAEWTNMWEDQVNVNCARITCANLTDIQVHEAVEEIAAKLGAV